MAKKLKYQVILEACKDWSTVKEVALKVGLSTSATWYRLDKLFREAKMSRLVPKSPNKALRFKTYANRLNLKAKPAKQEPLTKNLAKALTKNECKEKFIDTLATAVVNKLAARLSGN